MEPVPTQAWFPESDSRERRRIVEQSMRLGHYNTVVTLLWVTEEEDESDED